MLLYEETTAFTVNIGYLTNDFFKDYFYREGKGGRKRGRETSMCG